MPSRPPTLAERARELADVYGKIDVKGRRFGVESLELGPHLTLTFGRSGRAPKQAYSQPFTLLSFPFLLILLTTNRVTLS